MPVPVSTNVSEPTIALPVPARCAPAAFTEFGQPLPAAPGPHGQAEPVPSPKQYGVVGVPPGPHTARNSQLPGMPTDVIDCGGTLFADSVVKLNVPLFSPATH